VRKPETPGRHKEEKIMRINVLLTTASTLALAAALSIPAFAQVNGRKENQQDRVANGVKSGELTTGETSNIEQRESNLNHEIHADRQANGGKLTGQEKRQINRQQNRVSKQIYNDKHNGAVQKYGNNETANRRENQQDRLAQGIKSGKLNAGQTARLERQEGYVNQENRADRKANGGNLTNKQRHQMNHQLNRESRRIYRNKH